MYPDRNGRFHYSDSIDSYEGYRLPHWDVDDGVYFVTFRLADSIPDGARRELSSRYHREIDAFVERDDPEPGEIARRAFEFHLRTVDARLDEGAGACHLRNERVARLVRDSIRHFDGERYTLFVWTLMPNHVHVVFRRHADHSLAEVLHGWKSYTAHRARDIVEFGERFWQRDYFDRLIRDESEFKNVCEYVWSNPENAGLTDWEWRALERSG